MNEVQKESVPQTISDHPVFSKLCCPQTGQPLFCDGKKLINQDSSIKYAISDSGIPLFADTFCSSEAGRQREHYEKVATQYAENLAYPHTKEYMEYLDKVFLDQVDSQDLEEVAEICCGQGELLSFAPGNIGIGVGIDISQSMLEIAKKKHYVHKDFMFVQGDATTLPFNSNSFRSIFMFGGIHHVPDRAALFSEVFRVLKPGGRFYFREPVSDFFLWRWLRAAIYSLSPALDAETERPLLWNETVPLLEKTGFHLVSWKTYGFLGFCFFMNSDVLVFNRLFRFVPGIRTITKIATYIDDITVRLPGLRRAGLQVVGVAKKPSVSRT